MEIEVAELEGGVRVLRLSGRLDMKGALLIDSRFTGLTAPHSGGAIVDLAGVDFIASIGIRLLLSNAKAMTGRGGCMVLCDVQPDVAEALRTAGIDTLIPIFANPGAALAALAG